jgi:hypothetical protein
VPIRTHRGRAAVYRTLWGWPLRSPRHLLAAVLVLVGIAGGLAVALSGDGPGRGIAAPPSSARVNQFDPASRSALPGAGRAEAAAPSGTRSAEAPAAALAVAEAWTRAFLDAPDGISSAQWVARLRPYTTEELLPTLQSVDPVNVPEAQVIGEPRTVSSGAGKAEVDVPTSAVVVRLLLVPTSAGWRVAGFEQAG